MRLIAITGQSFSSLWHNKARSFLAVLGIVIGIAAVISLVGIGKGLQNNVSDRITSLGTKDINIDTQDPDRPTATRQRGPGGGGGPAPGGFQFGSQQEATLTAADYQSVKGLSTVAFASPEGNKRLDVASSSDATTATQYQITGVSKDFFSIGTHELGSGSLFSGTNAAEVVLGASAAEDLGDQGKVGATIYIGGTEFKVVGVLKASENVGPFDRTAQNIYTGYEKWQSVADTTKFNSIVAQSTTESSLDKASEQIKAALMKNHGITDADKADFAVRTSNDVRSAASSIANGFTATLTGIAAISLLVGGIGIMNVMLVSVTERTREIGLRRALGAKTRNILTQFLVESTVLTVVGGAIGLLIAIGLQGHLGGVLSFVPGNRGGEDVTSVIEPATVFVAIGVSAVVGIAFGLFPALKASRLDPVQSLRYE